MSVEEIYALALRSIVGASCGWTTEAFRAYRESLKETSRRRVFRTGQPYGRPYPKISL